ncbi:MAG: hypothetical protein ACFFDI_31135 [Promethearchaeota archaeon]
MKDHLEVFLGHSQLLPTLSEKVLHSREGKASLILNKQIYSSSAQN